MPISGKPLPTLCDVTTEQLVSKEDPNELYTDVLKIGEGYGHSTSPRALAWLPHGLRERLTYAELRERCLWQPTSRPAIRWPSRRWPSTRSPWRSRPIITIIASSEHPGLTPKLCVCVAQLLITEILIMKTSKHPNIVEFIDSYVVRDQIWVRSRLPTSLAGPAPHLLRWLCRWCLAGGHGVHGQRLLDGGHRPGR